MSASDGATSRLTLPPLIRPKRKHSSPPTFRKRRHYQTATDASSSSDELSAVLPVPRHSVWRRSFLKLKEQQSRSQTDSLPQLRLFSATQTAPIGWQKPSWFHHEFQSFLPVEDPTQDRFWPLVEGRLDHTAARMLQAVCQNVSETPPSPKTTLNTVIKATKQLNAERQAKLLLDEHSEMDLVATPSSEVGDRIGAQTTTTGPWVVQRDYFGDWDKPLA